MDLPDCQAGRQLLLELYRHGLAAVDGRRCMRAALEGHAAPGRHWILAVGKAAPAMTLGAHDVLGAAIERALVVAPPDHHDPELQAVPGLRFIGAGHPLPDGGSLMAGEAALDLAARLPPGVQALLLVSGGASALIEAPEGGRTLEDLQRLSAEALSAGVDIVALNRMRMRHSRLKGGGLAALFRPGTAQGYFLSDVPGDDPAIVGSGLLAPTPGPAPVLVGSLDQALDAMALAARSRGLAATRHDARLTDDVAAVARRWCESLPAGSPRLLIGGGETLVSLPPAPGRGGRNQHLALHCAVAIAGREDCVILAAGSDGRDGNTADAGAVVDGGTVARAARSGVDVADSLRRADSNRCLAASGDLVHTGPTGTNVGDFLMGIVVAGPRAPSM